jgi:hypothetical protein
MTLKLNAGTGGPAMRREARNRAAGPVGQQMVHVRGGGSSSSSSDSSSSGGGSDGGGRRTYIGYVDGYVKHRHQRHGLGNVLFMINAALACGAEAFLVNTTNVLFGTANAFGRRMQSRPYTETLLRRFRVVQSGPKLAGVPALREYGACPNASTFRVRTFGQTREHASRVPALLERLWWPAVPRRKYKGIALGTCVGVRAGRDFSHRPIFAQQYSKAFEHLRSVGEAVQPLFVLADVPNAWKRFAAVTGEWNATQIDEDDVTQLAVARHCRNFILSQSSYHVWMAYAAVRPQTVILFNGTDPINTRVASPPWMEPWVVL